VPDEGLARLLAHELEASLLSLRERLRSLAQAEPCRRETEPCLAEVEALRELLRDFQLLEQTSLERRPFPIGPVLATLARRFAPIAAARGISLEIPESTVTAEGDPRATERVLANLLDNAVKFSAEKSRVEVSVRRRGSGVAIAVRDRGVGIPIAEQARVFEPFVRLDRETAGAGLGLSIARRLAEAQAGRIDLTSEPGRGTTFVLVLGEP
jgi:signal transduction histidine kinase